MEITVCFFEMILAFVPSQCLNLTRLFFRSFARSYISAFVYLPVYPIFHPFVPVFIHILCVRSFVGSVIPPFFRSIVRLSFPLLFCVRLGLFISALYYSLIKFLVCVKVYYSFQ